VAVFCLRRVAAGLVSEMPIFSSPWHAGVGKQSGGMPLSSSVNFPGARCVGGSFPSFEPLLKPSAKMASVDARTGLPEPVIPILPTSEFMSSITACESRVCLTKAFIGESR
jgi:hypothetical protein